MATRRSVHAARRIILVTGCPRSGTTAVGDYLADAPGAQYLYEPFNYHSGVRRIRRYFEVPGAGGFSASDLDDIVHGIGRLRLDLKDGLFPEDAGAKRLLKRVTGGRTRMSYWRCRLQPGLRTVIWKDPIAAFAAGEASRRHGIPVVATLRDPLAVAASFKRMGWGFRVPELAARLREAGLPSPAWPEACRGREAEPAVNGALTWLCVYGALDSFAGQGATLRFVDIADVVARPEATYRALYEWLGLSWTAGVARRIRRGYARRPDPAGELPRKAHVARRDLSRVNTYGQRMLAAEEAELVRKATADLWARLGAHPARLAPV